MQKHYPNLLERQKDDASSLETACLLLSSSISAEEDEDYRGTTS